MIKLLKKSRQLSVHMSFEYSDVINQLQNYFLNLKRTHNLKRKRELIKQKKWMFWTVKRFYFGLLGDTKCI